MLIHKSVYALFIGMLFLTGCARTYAPHGWLPETNDIPMNVRGGWMRLLVVPDSSTKSDNLYEYQGEFISADENSVYLMGDSLYIIRKKNIQNAVLELDQKSGGTYVGWTLGFVLTPVINGWLTIFTFPIGLIAGIAATTTEANRDRYEEDFPQETFWSKVQKFARFPQGIPDNLNLRNLTPVIKRNV